MWGSSSYCKRLLAVNDSSHLTYICKYVSSAKIWKIWKKSKKKPGKLMNLEKSISIIWEVKIKKKKLINLNKLSDIKKKLNRFRRIYNFLDQYFYLSLQIENRMPITMYFTRLCVFMHTCTYIFTFAYKGKKKQQHQL